MKCKANVKALEDILTDSWLKNLSGSLKPISVEV